jgi:hypothetical protein
MIDITIITYPKCPECGNEMVPLSGTKNYYGDKITVIPLDRWICIKCKYST